MSASLAKLKQMLKHPFRKAAGLLVLYSVIIVGIFVLQFKNESVIFKNIGQMRMSVAQTQDRFGNETLKNSMQIAFKGIVFTADDSNPARLVTNNKLKNLTLLSYEQTENSFVFNFTDETSITFSLETFSADSSEFSDSSESLDSENSDSAEDDFLFVSAKLPEQASALYLNYDSANGFLISEQSRTKRLVTSKDETYELTASAIDDDSIVFFNDGQSISYSKHNPVIPAVSAFTFASIPANSEKASESFFNATVKNFRNEIVRQAVVAIQDTATVPEALVAAYVAELSSQGRFSEAVSAVPDSFKRGNRRTYFTSPYFDNLVSMNQSLITANENLSNSIRNAIRQNSLNIFSVKDVAEFMLRNPDNLNVAALPKIPGSFAESDFTLAQATGILSVYTKLFASSSPLAEPLKDVVEKCVQTISESCSLSEGNLILSDGNISASFLQSIEAGCAILAYGKISANDDFLRAGRFIINSAFARNNNIDIRIMADVYPLLVPENKRYPHFEILGTQGNNTIWAWTCADSITYRENSNSSEATITINFRLGDSHYIIFNGIKSFKDIEIYDLPYHTDPRFETYNSSGFVYDQKTNTLFLKSRHKSASEVIRLKF